MMDRQFADALPSRQTSLTGRQTSPPGPTAGKAKLQNDHMAPQKLDIFCYHAVTASGRPLDDFCFMPVDRFRAQMKWLRASGYAPLPLKKAADALAAGRLPRRAVAVTFDDGFRNNVTVALPVLEQFRDPRDDLLVDRPCRHCVNDLGRTDSPSR